MGLKAFHLFFIIAADLLSVGFGAWCMREYSDSGEGTFLLLGIGGIAGSGILSVYLLWFLRKLKQIGYLSVAVMVSLFSGTASACPVCIGNPDSPLTISANAGVLFLMSVITVVLGAFGSLFLWWRAREKKYLASQNLL